MAIRAIRAYRTTPTEFALLFAGMLLFTSVAETDGLVTGTRQEDLTVSRKEALLLQKEELQRAQTTWKNSLLKGIYRQHPVDRLSLSSTTGIAGWSIALGPWRTDLLWRATATLVSIWKGLMPQQVRAVRNGIPCVIRHIILSRDSKFDLERVLKDAICERITVSSIVEALTAEDNKRIAVLNYCKEILHQKRDKERHPEASDLMKRKQHRNRSWKKYQIRKSSRHGFIL